MTLIELCRPETGDLERAAPNTFLGGTLTEDRDKLVRLRDDFERLARWAGEQNAGNAFAEQVAMYAHARLAEWDRSVEEWEP